MLIARRQKRKNQREKTTFWRKEKIKRKKWNYNPSHEPQSKEEIERKS